MDYREWAERYSGERYWVDMLFGGLGLKPRYVGRAEQVTGESVWLISAPGGLVLMSGRDNPTFWRGQDIRFRSARTNADRAVEIRIEIDDSPYRVLLVPGAEDFTDWLLSLLGVRTV